MDIDVRATFADFACRLRRCNAVLGRIFLLLCPLIYGGLPANVNAAATAMTSGSSHSCAINSAAAVQCWGDNRQGQLGTGSAGGIAATPVAVSGLPASIVAVTGGLGHTCALTSLGGVFCWGSGGYGQLGNGGTAQSATPVAVSGLGVAVAISAGWEHTCAVLNGGSVKCWGRNDDGQLGNGGSALSVLLPTDVSGLSTGVLSVSAGGQHTCATLQSGGARCWGSNAFGQVGDNGSTTSPRTSPVDVSGLSSGVSNVDAGYATTCARLASGGLKCWGYNNTNSVGDGTATNRLTPVDVTGLTAGVASVAVGYAHACAVLTSGALRCWGSNRWGQAGIGNMNATTTPVAVPLLGLDVVQVTVGDFHTCARIINGGVICWGRNWLGQTGDGGGGNAAVPVDVVGMQFGMSSVAPDRGGTCALSTGGGVKCWGDNSYGQIGDGTVGSVRTTPVQVSGLTSGIQKVARGGYSVCSLSLSGDAKCWGNNSWGQLGDGTYTSRSTPVAVGGGLAGNVADIGVSRHYGGSAFTCAVTISGAVQCWGDNTYGQLGDGSFIGSPTPVNVVGISGATAISLGESHACALISGGLKCWGRNNFGQLGNNSVIATSAVPIDVIGASASVSSFSAGNAFTCAIISGVAKCWGENGSREVGDGTNLNRLQPTTVVGLGGSATVISAGGYHACAIISTGATKCWGYGGVGQTGNGSFADSPTPTDIVLPLGSVARISAGHEHSCAVTTAGALKCWGNNDVGQLGVGTTSQRLQPSSSVAGFAASVTTISATPTAPFFGQIITIVAVVTGQAPTGTVAFRDGASVISGCGAVPLVDGRASCAASGFSIATHNISAAYSGDANNPASTSSVTALVVTPTPATVTLSASANPTVNGQPVTFTATVAGTNPSGSVTFYDGTTVIAGCAAVALVGSAPGVAACGPISALNNGTHTITVAYAGDASNGANSALLVQSVSQTSLASNAVIVAGSYHSCALSSGGVVKCWGDNDYFGQLGNSSGVKSALPVTVTGLGSNVRGLSAGNYHSCAITGAGGVMCWGDNSYGQLGDGSTARRTTPVAVTGLSATVVAIAAGANHSCALLSTGAMQCWGNNASGQLGTGSTSPSSQPTPTFVSGLSSGVVLMAAGGGNTCALTASGGVKCWGSARVGDGTTTSRSVPTDVLGLSSGVAAISVGNGHSCATQISGAVQCWGSNGSGQLGDGTTVTRAVAVSVFGLGGAVARVTAGPFTTCAVLGGGALKCWGSGIYGKVGDGANLSINTAPAPVIGLASGVASVAVGQSHVCALSQGGSVRCWGRNTEGQLGEGSFGLALSPTFVQPVSTDVSGIVAGGFHACSTDAIGAMKCWGSRSQGAVGDGVISNMAATTPVAVSGLAGSVAQMAAGLSHTCTRSTANALQCWGGNANYGQLGDGTTINRAVPGPVSGLATAISVANGYFHTCAVTTSGGVKCWGYNSAGQLGNGMTSYSAQSTPVDVTGLASGVAAVSAGGNNSCAVTAAGALACWGDNSAGQIGDGTTIGRISPVNVAGLGSGVIAVGAGYTTCVLISGGAVQCWGDNSSGTVGDGTNVNRASPTNVTGLGAAATMIAVGGSHACALLASGGVKCWGNNSQAQLGDGTLVSHTTPFAVPGLTSGVVAIAAGVQFTCAVLNSGAVKCWGDNQAGQIGDGTVGYRTTATGYVAQPSLTSPLSVADASVVSAAVDGALIARYLAGMRGSAVTSGLNSGGGLRTDPDQVNAYLETIRPLLDIDGNGQFSPLTDGLLLIRYMAGLRDAALLTGAVGAGATRDAAAIQAYLGTLLP